MDREKYTIREENGEVLTLMRCGGIEYVTSAGVSYYIDSEMISSSEYETLLYIHLTLNCIKTISGRML